MNKVVFSGVVLGTSLLACGSGNHNKTPDARGAGGSAVCTATSSYGAASIVAAGSGYAFTAAEIAADGSAGLVDANQGFTGNLNADTMPDSFEIDLYAGFGAFTAGSAITTGSVTLAGDDLSYQTCGLCLQLYTDLGSDGSPTDLYFATAGSVNLTSVGTATGSNVSTGTLAGTLSNVSFAHWDGQNDVAVGDCNSTLTSLSFSATLVAVPAMFQSGPSRIIGRRSR